MMSHLLDSPAANGFQVLRQLTKSNMCILSTKSYGTRPIARPRIACNMNVVAGQSDEPHKFNLENIIDRTRKLWDS
ncbi:hypothetical protein A4A49_36863 [Nicotiana attenuata]|uniref:Uncharacterized protein n=1 Tax=Nicotiana attenuata TaxID=49451 RepID=A0A1J6KCZ7_NICAT|nr:hypothetical protein A4A49_36863 [Nicotiana attenuata]